MSSPDITAAEIEAVNEVLRTRRLSLGPRVETFEAEFAAYVGAPHAVAVSSGTAGLHLGVIAAGVDVGDMVITTPFSFVASANVILYERGVPVFVDIDPDTLNIAPDGVAQAVRDLDSATVNAAEWLPPSLQDVATAIRPATAILPVHAFGQPADMDPILDVAEEYGVSVIEDACEAIGAEYRGRRVGSVPPDRAGWAAVFAFYPNKQMTTGEGGMIVTDREPWADLFRSLRNQGRDVFDAWLNHARLGYNYRMDEMSAALGVVQLGRLDELIRKRAQVAAWYDERLADMAGVQVLRITPTTTRMSWFVYVVRLTSDQDSGQPDRNSVIAALAADGVPSRPYFTPIHLQPFYREWFGFEPGAFPVTEDVARSALALPFSGVMTEGQVDFVCEKLAALLASRQ
jgi:perosamine synthetase